MKDIGANTKQTIQSINWKIYIAQSVKTALLWNNINISIFTTSYLAVADLINLVHHLPICNSGALHDFGIKE